MASRRLFKFSTRLQTAVFRLTHGKALASLRGMPILLMTTMGRKTGAPRTVPLMYIRDGNNYFITASNSGSDRHPAWYLNLLASPEATIELPGESLQVTATVAAPGERDRLWPQLVARAPFFAGYQRNTTRHIPMVILKPR